MCYGTPDHFVSPTGDDLYCAFTKSSHSAASITPALCKTLHKTTGSRLPRKASQRVLLQIDLGFLLVRCDDRPALLWLSRINLDVARREDIVCDGDFGRSSRRSCRRPEIAYRYGQSRRVEHRLSRDRGRRRRISKGVPRESDGRHLGNRRRVQEVLPR
jgi:hypothetical protein